MNKAYHSLNGLYVRKAEALGRDSVRLELSPSDKEDVAFLQHLNLLSPAESFSVEIPMAMIEHLYPPDEFGSREHKLALLAGNCVNLRVALGKDHILEVADASPDLSYVVTGNEKTGFRPTARFNRLFRQSVGDLAKSSVFNHIRGFFQDNNGFLLPTEENKALKGYQKDMLRILSPYTMPFCDSPEHAKGLGHAQLDGDYMKTAWQRIHSLEGVLSVEDTFAGLQSNSTVHGKVTLSDILGCPSDNQWTQAASEKLDRALGQGERLDHAVYLLDTYVRKKMPDVVSNAIQQRLGRTFSPEQKEEVKQLFGQFVDGILQNSRKTLQPLNDFASSVGLDARSRPECGLAVLTHLAADRGWDGSKCLRMSDGTDIDFTQDLARLVSDPRSFGAELPENRGSIQQAANLTVLHHVAKELSRSYWGISSPLPCLATIQALQAQTQQKVVDRFTNVPDPLPNPAGIYEKFDSARELLMSCTSNFLCGHKDVATSLAMPPKSLFGRLMEQGSGMPEVSRSRGILLRSSCAVFRRKEITDDQVENLLKECSTVTGRPSDDYLKEADFLVNSYSMSRPEAAAALLLHEAIDKNNGVLAAKLDAFGKENVPDYEKRLEAALDSHVQAQALTVPALARMVSDSPDEVVKALNPDAKIQGELANSKAAAVAAAAMKSMEHTLRRSIEAFKSSLPSSLEFNNLEGCVYSGPQSAKIVGEIVEEKLEDAMIDYFRLSAVPDTSQREQLMNLHSARLAECAERSKDAVEIEADSKCYPSGRSPKRVARDLLKDAFNKAVMGQAKMDVDPHLFAAPAM